MKKLVSIIMRNFNFLQFGSKAKNQEKISKYSVRKVINSDIPALIELFKEVFKEEMSYQFWNWKYKKSHHNLALINEKGSIVGFYGGIPREIIFFGESATAVQVSDTMIKNNARGGKGKNSRLYKLVTEFCENHVGRGREYFLVYGFPHRRVMRVAEIFGIYKETDRISLITWELILEKPTLRYEKVNEKHRNEVNLLWNIMKKEFDECIIGVRDFEYIAYRYLKHPKHKYELFCVYEGKTDLSFIVICKKEGEVVRLMDVIAPRKRYEDAILFARTISHEMGCSSLIFWITTSQKSYFENTSGKIEDADISIATYGLLNSCSHESIQNKWWLTAGDTDFL